ncbi:unnamed protein product [Paramecium pentaurelia]|uniref:Uncharacterized protein n=1 Tax=Paramecium pentaurelia TaxID=43138 RepID=A0A8S1V8V7_9CILI|nr:unnamed protein product [Paramecium pentaurelia]
MSKLFTFSNVNTIKDIDSISNKRNLLIFEKYIQNKLKKTTVVGLSKLKKFDQRIKTCNMYKENLKQSSQSSFNNFDLRSHRLNLSEKSLASILINKQRETNSIKAFSRPSSIHKKVSFQNLVIVIDTNIGIQKKEKLIDKESKLRNGYFFNSNQIIQQ